MAVLRVKAGPEKGKRYEIPGDSLTLGRDSAGDIQILDQGVSRKHSEIFRIGEMYFIRDLESRNGTFVNDQKIGEEILRIGDRIAIGNTVLVFEDRDTRLKDAEQLISADPGPVASPTSTIHLKLTREVPSARPKKDHTVEERNLEILLHLSHIIAEEKDLTRLFHRVSELVGKSLDADHLYVLGVTRKSTNGKSRKAQVGFEVLGRYDKEENVEMEAGVSRGIINDCLERSRSVLTSDASLDQQFNAMASVVMKQLRSVICVPITALRKSIGVLYVYSNQADAFKGEDLELASAIGIQLGSTMELLKMLRRADQFLRNSVRTLVTAVEMRLPEESGRSERVAGYCLAVAKELGLPTHQVRDAWLAGMLYNVGSIPMTESERGNKVTFETRRNHYARELLRGSPALEQVLPALEQQNERFDGSGTPDGKKGDEIHLLAGILGMGLEFDRLLYSGGPDSDELSIKEALLKMKEMADKKFKRQLVNALLIAYRSGRLFNRDESFFEVPDS